MVQALQNSKATVVLMLTNRNTDSKQMKKFVKKYSSSKMSVMTNYKRGEEMNVDEVTKELYKKLSKHLNMFADNTLSIENWCSVTFDIKVDENTQTCQMARRYMEHAVEDVCHIPDKTFHLPLHTVPWKEYSCLLKKYLEIGSCMVMSEREAINLEMENIRHKQVEKCKQLSPLMQRFLMIMISNLDNEECMQYIYKWIELYLSNFTRLRLPSLRQTVKAKAENLQITLQRQESNTKQYSEYLQAEKALIDCQFGIENIICELGQIFESISHVIGDQDRKLISLLDRIPLFVAKLILSGHTFEILDGDTGNVPIVWVSAVFRNVIELIGDKRVFKLSALGVQSSGKSTMLNTMFGTRFPVSSGRCTKGAFIRLIPIQKYKENVGYEYVLVIDTEGLRSTEKVLNNYDSDHKMATFAVGISDVTIVNIKGENTSEMHEILQIVVHAFMRLKLVNKDLNLAKTCVFVHQNVSNYSSREPLLLSRTKLKQNLDQLTIEAAQQENIHEINCFNDVIKFNENKHSWYLPDLFTGDTMLQYVSSRYVEGITQIKHCIIEEISRQNLPMYTFSETLKYLSDLWNAIMTENFVFSFRNSLEISAYKQVEGKCKKLIHSLEDHLEQWIKENVRSDFCNHNSVADEERRMEKIMQEIKTVATQKTTQLILELDKFCEEGAMKASLVKWRQRRTPDLWEEMKKIVTYCELEIMEMRDRSRIDSNKTNSNVEIERMINTRASNLATELRGKHLNEDDLDKYFEDMWTRIIHLLKPQICPNEENVLQIIKSALRQEFTSNTPLLLKELKESPLESYIEVIRLEGSFLSDNIKKEDLNIKSKLILKKQFDNFRQNALMKTNRILRKIDSVMNSIDSSIRFKEAHIRNILSIISGNIQDHNEKNAEKAKFTFLPLYNIKLSVHVCRCLIPKFESLNKRYSQLYSLEAFAESHKQTAKEHFCNIINDRKNEEIAVTFFIQCLDDVVKRIVKDQVFSSIERDVLDHFEYRKDKLIFNIRKWLLEKEDLSFYIKYIDDPKLFSFEWIAEYVDENYFTTNAIESCLHFKMTVEKSGQIIKLIRRAIEMTSESHVKTLGKSLSTLSEDSLRSMRWIYAFIRSANGMSTIKMYDRDFERMKDLSINDVTKFKLLVLLRIEEFENSLLSGPNPSEFSPLPIHTRTLYETILERLWGCPEMCPYCREPCEMSEKDHFLRNIKHSCTHRPIGFSGLHLSPKISLHSCNFLMKDKKAKYSCVFINNKCRKSGKCMESGNRKIHKYSEYTEFFPEWDIQPLSKPNTDFWTWFVKIFRKELSTQHGINFNFSSSFWLITKNKAEKSLVL